MILLNTVGKYAPGPVRSGRLRATYTHTYTYTHTHAHMHTHTCPSRLITCEECKHLLWPHTGPVSVRAGPGDDRPAVSRGTDLRAISRGRPVCLGQTARSDASLVCRRGHGDRLSLPTGVDSARSPASKPARLPGVK